MSAHRVIFVDPEIWTSPRGANMTDDSTPINRPLNDDERDLLNHVLMWKVRENIALDAGVHVTPESVAAALDDLIEKTGLERSYDEHNVYVQTLGRKDQVILRCSREWLAFHTQHDEQLSEDKLREARAKGDIA